METGLDRRDVPHARGGDGRRPAERRRARADERAERARRSARTPAPSRTAPLRPGRRPARRGGARAAGRLLLRDVRPHRHDDVRRQPDAARARRHGRVPRPAGSSTAARSEHIVRLIRNSEDRNPAGIDGRRSWATAARRTTRRRGAARRRSSSTRTAGSCVEDFVSLNGTIVNCAGGASLGHRSWITGEEAVGGPDAAAANMRFGKRHGYLFETPVGRDAGRARGRGADRRRGALRARGVRGRPGARASSTRRRTRAACSAPASTATCRTTRAACSPAATLAHARRSTGHPQADLRENQEPGVPLPVRWVPIDDPDPTLLNVAGRAQHVQPGLGGGRREVLPPGGLLGGPQHDLLRVHGRRRREERRPHRRLPRGLRPGLGLPARARPRRRHAHARLRVAVRRGAGLAGQPDGHAARRADDVRGRRLGRAPRPASARARPRARQPRDRADARRRGVRVRRERPQQLGAGRRLLQPERPDDVLQPLRPLDHAAPGSSRRRA